MSGDLSGTQRRKAISLLALMVSTGSAGYAIYSAQPASAIPAQLLAIAIILAGIHMEAEA